MRLDQIPVSFQLGGRTIKIVIKNTLASQGLTGQALFESDEIHLQRNLAGVPISKSNLQITMFHELMHFLYNFVGEETLGSNEKHVEMMAQLLYQSLKTMTYK